MSKLHLFLSVGLMVGQVGRACDVVSEEEQLAAARYQSEEYFANAFGYDPAGWNALYYPNNAKISRFGSPYEGQTVSSSLQSRNHPHKNYYESRTPVNENANQPEGRFALGGLGASIINTGLFNNRFSPANTWRPFANLANRIPVSYNPNFDNPLDTFDACTSPSGDAGICVPGSVCSLFRGRPSGSCVLGKVCCVSKYGHGVWGNSYAEQHVLAVSYYTRKRLLHLRVNHQIGHQVCGTAQEAHLPNPARLCILHYGTTDAGNLRGYIPGWRIIFYSAHHLRRQQRTTHVPGRSIFSSYTHRCPAHIQFWNRDNHTFMEHQDHAASLRCLLLGTNGLPPVLHSVYRQSEIV